MVRARWDGDDQGSGVAPIGPLGEDVAAFLAAAREPGWVTEAPLAHLRPKLDAWLAAAPRPWRDVELTLAGPWLIITATWIANGRARDIRADAYALLGSFVENEAFIRETRRPDRVYELATGLPQGGFAPHGHLIRLIVREHGTQGGPLESG